MLNNRLSNNPIDYRPPDFKAEAHFIGQIIGASNVFESDGIFCEVFFETGDDWKMLSDNIDSYQTQTGYPSFDKFITFSHPFDLHYTSKNIYGWPKLICRVWKLDNSSKIDLYAYGCTTLPNTQGYHEFKFNTWMLQGDLKSEILSYYLNTKPKMNTIDPVASTLKDREEILSKPGPVIHMYCEVLLKNFNFHSITGQI